MTMKKLYKLLLLIAGISILYSCKKQLSEPPADASTNVTAVTDQQSAQVVLNGAYNRFANVNSNNVTDWTYHELSGGMLTGMLGYGAGAAPDETNNNVSSSYVPPLWTDAYNLVNAVNGLISGVNKLPNSVFTGNRKNEMLAEADFLRAYADFKLLIFFSEWNDLNSKNGVLLRTELSTINNAQQARSTVAESYDAILNDLHFAIQKGPTTNPNYYMNRWAAMALKMRVLMCRAQSGDYAQVISLADSVIQNGPYTLEPNLKDLFYIKGLSSSEVILGIKPQPNQENSYYILSRAYYPGQSAIFCCTKAFKDLLANDPRRSWMVGDTLQNNPTPNTNYFTKFIPNGSSPTQISETSYAIRLTEVYLLKAEAILHSGGNLGDAKDLIKTVMSKAGVTDFSAINNANDANSLLLQNYYEVLRNLTGEDGIEWMTLLRFPLATITQLRPTITSNVQLYFPVPHSELDYNKLFGAQNKGYAF
jgi:starch-binding outer membrane protein, SusD/RagB family